jgi:quercetin dioxygenase-like cupin family protein
MVRHRYLAAALTAVVAASVAGGVTLATPASGVTPTNIAAGGLAPVNILVKTDDWMSQLRTKGDSTVAVVENRLASGATFGWHSHPGPSVIVVKAGEVTFYRGDDPTCTPVRYGVGQALVDPGNIVHVGRNEGSVDAIVIVTRFLPAGAGPRNDEPANPACPF